jgi:probable F420-dependent oxidoreductase
MVSPFRFGVSYSNAASAEEWRQIARKAEDLGYDTFSAPDHIRGSFAPMVALAAAAEATTRIRIGTLVINNDFRHPVLLAREAATLDFLSSGRFELGLGAGHAGDEYREAGIPFEEPPVRVQKLDEAVQVIKRMWAGGEATFEGKHYQVRGHTSHPAPVQQPIPILIGGNGKDLLGLAAREADIVGFTGIFLADNGVGVAFPHFTVDGLAERVELVRSAAGPRFETLELHVLVQGVETERPRDVAEEWAANLKLSADDLLASPFTMFGEVDALVDKLHAVRERLGISYISTHWHGMEKLAPIVQRLSGK